MLKKLIVFSLLAAVTCKLIKKMHEKETGRCKKEDNNIESDEEFSVDECRICIN